MAANPGVIGRLPARAIDAADCFVVATRLVRGSEVPTSSSHVGLGCTSRVSPLHRVVPSWLLRSAADIGSQRDLGKISPVRLDDRALFVRSDGCGRPRGCDRTRRCLWGKARPQWRSASRTRGCNAPCSTSRMTEGRNIPHPWSALRGPSPQGEGEQASNHDGGAAAKRPRAS